MDESGKAFTVAILSNVLGEVPPEFEVWIRMADGVAYRMTHAKLGSLGHGDIKLILQCEPDSTPSGETKP